MFRRLAILVAPLVFFGACASHPAATPESEECTDALRKESKCAGAKSCCGSKNKSDCACKSELEKKK